MARNTTIDVPAGVWTQLTDADVTSVTFQNQSGYPVFVKGTTDATAPTTAAGSIRYNPGQGELNTEMADLFPGLAAVRLWAFTDLGVSVFISHA